jgi:hypothetical protein
MDYETSIDDVARWLVAIEGTLVVIAVLLLVLIVK